MLGMRGVRRFRQSVIAWLATRSFLQCERGGIPERDCKVGMGEVGIVLMK